MDERKSPGAPGNPGGKKGGRILTPVAADDPYPVIEVSGPNPQYARMLQIDLASGHSEMTSITQYIYDSWRLDPRFANVAETLRRIAMVEMHHLDILGKLIVLLGGDPKYMAVQQRPQVWNGNMVTYSRQFAAMMRDNILAEQMAIDTYARQAEIIRDEHIAALLRRILQDEYIHIELFRQYLDAAE